MVLLMKKSKDPKYSALNLLTSISKKLEETLNQIEKTSLTQVSCEKPMYGLIRCVKMILGEIDRKEWLKKRNEYAEYFKKLIQLLLRYDEVLFPPLGNEAPEGFLPELPDSKEDNSQVVR